MRKGTCKCFTGTINETCEKGINYRQHVGGEDSGWVVRMPCFRKNHGNEGFKNCLLYAEPTAAELEAHEKEIKERMSGMSAAIAAIREKHPWCKPEFKPTLDSRKQGASGKIDCPKCGLIEGLSYSISSGNHHIWGRCRTDGCLSWMM